MTRAGVHDWHGDRRTTPVVEDEQEEFELDYAERLAGVPPDIEADEEGKIENELGPSAEEKGDRPVEGGGKAEELGAYLV